jgi:natural product precursor
MKTNLKLNALASKSLSKVEMNQFYGGKCCSCGCQGSSSTNDNAYANSDGGKQTKAAKAVMLVCDNIPIRL